MTSQQPLANRRSRARKLFPRVLAILATCAIAAPAGAQSGTSGHLPTPYTAEQIRDAWVEGFWLDTEIRTAQSTERMRTRVTSWTEQGSEMVDLPLDADGNEGEPGPVSTTTWNELRDHALFSADKASRERETRTTTLGELEGWLYTVRGEHGAVTELFFADGLPGAPVWFRQLQGDQELFVAEQTGRGVDR